MKLLMLGLGTVGSGVIKILESNKDKITRKMGNTITVTHAYVKDIKKERDVDVSNIELTDDIDIAKHLDVDMVVEVMGSINETKEIVAHFLGKKVPVVTANKDMLAVYIDELENIADKNNVQFKYEAAVAGSIPIIRTIETSFNSNEITRVMGILNGTTNFILSEMGKHNSYKDALEEATRLGYAEQDPTNDVDGIDASRKIVLLARLAFNMSLILDEVDVRGIRDIDTVDIKNLEDEGYKVKLVGDAERVGREVFVSVAPKAFKTSHILANTNGSMNGVFLKGNAFNDAFMYGPGAGSLETASAVVSDIINAYNEEPNYDIPTTKARIHKKMSEKEFYVRTAEGYTFIQAHEGQLQKDNTVLQYFELVGD
ncbi:hypothetical protein GCM10007358_04160 [Phocicoccus schoeneichii]|uniref:Homoserine dehydrogenase n=1 Tax=Phocicoccus schoeneichii TaxID=1812261 RepID=A0A6V7RFY6_9BACL|nr:homoserine dehydrogenase [Jeotgalicoccus schoeneichii]GGH48549.1 hypothetical protein GCM10007358_04160 [Jeotgalicoccus schoeneichii]CAD2076728.1 Homoserine dehydrogenase [Jeotgalicoccus schoeneichii]